jgi:hypothetical protein
MKKLTNAIIDQRLLGRGIKRIGNYTGSNTPIAFLCEKCNYKWDATPGSVSGKRKIGCANCSGLVPLNNEIIDQQLEGRKIKRIGDYINAKTPITFLCEKCHHEWNTIAGHICGKNKSGCPRCAGNAPLNNEIIDQLLKDRNIKRIGNYINNRTPITFLCEICENYWNAATDNVCGKNSGCPLCSIGKNEKLVAKILKEANIPFLWHETIIYYVDGARKRMYPDFILLDMKAWIEYDGIQHYEPTSFYSSIDKETAKQNFIKQQQRDYNQTIYCKENGINLIRINGKEYAGSKLEKYMKETIIPQLLNNINL